MDLGAAARNFCGTRAPGEASLQKDLVLASAFHPSRPLLLGMSWSNGRPIKQGMINKGCGKDAINEGLIGAPE
jgi:hypothetical protein